jgi:hypothetical protein
MATSATHEKEHIAVSNPATFGFHESRMWRVPARYVLTIFPMAISEDIVNVHLVFLTNFLKNNLRLNVNMARVAIRYG